MLIPTECEYLSLEDKLHCFHTGEHFELSPERETLWMDWDSILF
jgi:hypothetical protein